MNARKFLTAAAVVAVGVASAGLVLTIGRTIGATVGGAVLRSLASGAKAPAGGTKAPAKTKP